MSADSDSFVFNSIMLAVVVGFSIAFSIGLYAVTTFVLGEPIEIRLVWMFGGIAGLCSFTAGLPAVWFADVVIEHIREASYKLDEALAQAQLANRTKSEFLATMSHEIRTPLNGVLGMAQVLQRTDLDEDQSEMVATIQDSGDTLLEIVSDILDLSKIEAGKMEIDACEAELTTAVRSVVRLFEPKAQEKGVVLSLEFADDVPNYASFDPVRVRQCIANLVSNAVKFTREGSVAVSVSASPAADGNQTITVEVKDTGVGIDASGMVKLFGAFEQAQSSTAREFGGTGLGLAISRKLARMMGGDIVASSQSGAGSNFSLTFQTTVVAVKALETERTAADQRSVGAALSGLRVLVVDDNSVNRRILQLLLATKAAHATEARNGAEALERLAAETFDLVLLDMHMPVLDGKETIAAIRASECSWCDIRVIALTADAMAGEREKLLALGMDGYASKPIDAVTLYAEIANVLAPALEKMRSA